MSGQWYYSKNNQQKGPVSEQELKRMALSGELRPSDLVWSQGMSSWVAAQSVAMLYPQGASPAAGPQNAATDDLGAPRPRRRRRYDDDYDDFERRPRRARQKKGGKGLLIGLLVGGGAFLLLLLVGMGVFVWLVAREIANAPPPNRGVRFNNAVPPPAPLRPAAKVTDMNTTGMLFEGQQRTHAVFLKANTTYHIDLLSNAFDPVLDVENNFGNRLASNDDGGMNLNSYLSFRPTRSGNYRLIVRGWGGDGGGQYRLVVRH